MVYKYNARDLNNRMNSLYTLEMDKFKPSPALQEIKHKFWMGSEENLEFPNCNKKN